MGGDQVHGAKDAGEHPEHHQSKADHPDWAVEEFAIKAKPPLEGDRKGEKHHQRSPCGQHLPRHGTDDTCVCAQDQSKQQIGKGQYGDHQKGKFDAEVRHRLRIAREGEGTIGVGHLPGAEH